MRKLSKLESSLFVITGVFVITNMFVVSENEKNKTYLDISLKENRLYISDLLVVNPLNPNLLKQLNNTNAEIQQIEKGTDYSPLFRLSMIFGFLLIFVYFILPLIPNKKEDKHV